MGLIGSDFAQRLSPILLGIGAGLGARPTIREGIGAGLGAVPRFQEVQRRQQQDILNNQIRQQQLAQQQQQFKQNLGLQTQRLGIAQAQEVRRAAADKREAELNAAIGSLFGVGAAPAQTAGGAVGVTGPSAPFPELPPGTPAATAVATRGTETAVPALQPSITRGLTPGQTQQVGILASDPKTRAQAFTLARQLRKENRAAAKQAETQATRKAQRTTAGQVVVQDIDRALDIVQRNPTGTTGMGGAVLSNIPGTEAANVFQLLQSVKANAGFDRLQQMRESSPTGGALGQVSNLELGLLQSAIGSLEQSQTTEQFQDNLRRVKNTYLDIIHGPGEGPKREVLQFQQQQTQPQQPAAPGVFANAAEAQAALGRGEIQLGDTITVGGQRVRVAP